MTNHNVSLGISKPLGLVFTGQGNDRRNQQKENSNLA
jgi:hypothetical protein